MSDYMSAYQALADQLTARGVDVDSVKAKLKNQHIETPSWGYGDSGTRFKTFACPGAARNIYEKTADAAYIHKLSGIAPSVALHIPWDKTDDWQRLTEWAGSLGVTLGAINPNLFQDDVYKLGSVCHPSKSVRRRAADHLIECCEIMRKTESKILSIWLADGTNYAGQDSIRDRKHRLEESLAEAYKHLPDNSRLLTEYKLFEPAFYHTDLADWGMAYTICQKLGPQAEVLVDLGHHAQATNVVHILAFLLDEKRLGGLHFNARQYADDDLIVGSVNPWELFLIYTELVDAGAQAENVSYMIDQSHNIEPKLEAMLRSVLNCQIAYAKALVVDYPALHASQLAGDILQGHGLLMDGYQTDVRPLLKQVRAEMDVQLDPIAFLRNDSYPTRIIEERSTADPSVTGDTAA